MITLTGYDNSNGDAKKIIVRGNEPVRVYDTEDNDVTQYLYDKDILAVVSDFSHGWVAALKTATAFDVTEVFLLMSEAKNVGETPVMFFRLENSETGIPLKSSDVTSVTYTISRGRRVSMVGETRKEPISEEWTDVSIPVEDVFFDEPIDTDRRVDFGYNFRFEPNTLTENPFGNPGTYYVDFTVTPVSGNKIPVCFVINLKENL